jgi:hypothetical protein
MKDFPIKPVQKGGTPTLLDTIKANEVIGIVNALATMKIMPDGIGSIKVVGETAVLDLSGANSNTTLADRIGSLENKVGQLIDSISNGSLNVSCDPNTSNINASLNFPNFPNSNF